MEIDKDIAKKPEPTLHERLYEVAKPIAESLPCGGPIAVFLYNKVVGDPARERLERWIKEVADGVVNLQERTNELDLNNLEHDPLFQTILRRAAWAAINDHQKEKLKALRNAVLNSARSIDLDENRQLMFVNLIDRMTELHLRVLIFLRDPKKPLREMGVNDITDRGGSLRQYLLKYFSVPETDPHGLIMVIRDLQASWLVQDDVYGEQTGISLFTPRTKPGGAQLVDFIKSPLPEEEFGNSDL